MIELADVSKVYGKGNNQFSALKAISLSIDGGKSIAIVGKSGSGKSTLMHVMSGLDRQSAGTVSIDGQDLSSLKRKALDTFRAKKIGFIFQSFFVQGNETCMQNVMLPLEIAEVSMNERKERALAALKSVGLDDKRSQKAKNLSGGQKQRLAIARAIVNEPAILFADEPTGNLDTTTGEAIEDLLFNYVRDKHATLIVVTHDQDLSRRCDRRVAIKDGRLLTEAQL